MQYCYNIINPEKSPIDEIALKNFVKNIYTNKARFPKYAFEIKSEDLPYIPVYSKSDEKVCTVLKGKGEANRKRIEKIHTKITDDDLVFGDISLSKPYIFDVSVDNWWKENPNLTIQGDRWTSLRHNGPYFAHILNPYKPQGLSLIYDGKKYPLTPKEEKIARYYANRIVSEKSGNVSENWTKDKIFNKNFFHDFKKFLTKEHRQIFEDFKKLDFSDIVEAVEHDKVKNQEKDKKQKNLAKVLVEEKKHNYAYGFIDGNREKIGNFTVEPGAIFYGRGANADRGRIKRDIDPEDVTINIGENDPVPKPPNGHTWGQVVHDHGAVWLAKWNDPLNGQVKYIFFAAEGKFKGEGDMVKYEKARKLQRNIKAIREKYMKDATSSSTTKRQLGTVLYIIDHFGFRVGNETSAEDVDTIGASTLRVGHVKFEGNGDIVFDFLGKDSIRFYKKLNVPPIIYENIQLFTANKSKDKDIFDKITPRDINSYLKEFDSDFSAKVFRTRLASYLMYTSLLNVEVPKGSTKAVVENLFKGANKVVAEVLNHTRTISKKAEQAVAKNMDKLEVKKEELKQKRKEGKSTTALEKSIDTLKTKIATCKTTLEVSISTSLNNYIDPRIIVSWSSKNDVQISYVYTAALLKKFKWAIEITDSDWDWLSSPILGVGLSVRDSYSLILDFCNDEQVDLSEISPEVWKWLKPHLDSQKNINTKARELLTAYRKYANK